MLCLLFQEAFYGLAVKAVVAAATFRLCLNYGSKNSHEAGRGQKCPGVPHCSGRWPSPRDGKFIEEIGTYNAKKADNVKLDLERAKYWLSKGAQPSDTVASFIKKAAKSAAMPVAA